MENGTGALYPLPFHEEYAQGKFGAHLHERTGGPQINNVRVTHSVTQTELLTHRCTALHILHEVRFCVVVVCGVRATSSCVVFPLGEQLHHDAANTLENQMRVCLSNISCFFAFSQCFTLYPSFVAFIFQKSNFVRCASVFDAESKMHTRTKEALTQLCVEVVVLTPPVLSNTKQASKCQVMLFKLT